MRRYSSDICTPFHGLLYTYRLLETPLTREQMVSRRGSSGYLPVQELAAALQLLYQVGQKRADFFLSIRKLNAEHGCAVEHTVQMILQRIDLIIKYHCRLINAVSKNKIRGHWPGSSHIVNAGNFSVIICQIFHFLHVVFFFFSRARPYAALSCVFDI